MYGSMNSKYECIYLGNNQKPLDSTNQSGGGNPSNEQSQNPGNHKYCCIDSLKNHHYSLCNALKLKLNGLQSHNSSISNFELIICTCPYTFRFKMIFAS